MGRDENIRPETPFLLLGLAGGHDENGVLREPLLLLGSAGKDEELEFAEGNDGATVDGNGRFETLLLRLGFAESSSRVAPSLELLRTGESSTCTSSTSSSSSISMRGAADEAAAWPRPSEDDDESSLTRIVRLRRGGAMEISRYIALNLSEMKT